MCINSSVFEKYSTNTNTNTGEQGWCTGVRALASHQCVPGSIPRPGVIYSEAHEV